MAPRKVSGAPMMTAGKLPPLLFNPIDRRCYLALPATHIRFAMETAHCFAIKNWNAFLSGTLYPDSRWLTGVDRTATHNDLCLSYAFTGTDFRTGWHLHCLCDHIQKEVLYKGWPALTRLNRHEGWVHLAVAKMIQDRADMSHIDMAPYLSALDHVETPNGENRRDVESYFRHIRSIYYGLYEPGIDDYRKLWLGVGLEDHLLSELLSLADRQMVDAAYMADLQGVYDDMVSIFRRHHRPQVAP